jgi:hypothetical protein
MPKVFRLFALCCQLPILLLLAASTASAQTVWSGLSYTFTKADGTDPLLPSNQDRITNDVWITRNAFGMGLLNAAQEPCDQLSSSCTYTHNSSPLGTEWATAVMVANSTQTIAASNWQNLAFDDWESAYQGAVGNYILNSNYRDVVVHLIAENVYLDLRFLGWTNGHSGSTGGFSYIRATGTVPPQTTGDYNGNGVVDAADYVVWRNTINQNVTPGTGADGVPNGTIDSSDYTYWRARFGNLAGSGTSTSAAAVPEPGALALALLGLISLFRFRRRAS